MKGTGMNNDIVSREYISITHCDRLEDGSWKAISSVYDKVLYAGKDEWVEEKVDAMAMDDKPDEAIKVAMNSVLAYLVQNVYENGFQSLVEYRDYKRALEEKKALSGSEAKGI